MTGATAIAHADFVKLVAQIRYSEGQRPVLSEPSLRGGGESPDVISWDCWGRATVDEIKVSETDFKRDSDKDHREYGMGTYRWFWCPAGLIEPYEVEGSGWGLKWVSPETGEIAELVTAEQWRRGINHCREKMYLIQRDAKDRAAESGTKPKPNGGAPKKRELTTKQAKDLKALVQAGPGQRASTYAKQLGITPNRVADGVRAGEVDGVTAEGTPATLELTD